MLRATPGFIDIRPADANETVEAWKIAVQRNDKPVALMLTRQNVPTIDRSVCAPASGVTRGAYVLADAAGDAAPELILIASGSEVQLRWRHASASPPCALTCRASLVPPLRRSDRSIARASCWRRAAGGSQSGRSQRLAPVGRRRRRRNRSTARRLGAGGPFEQLATARTSTSAQGQLAR
jgi:hypothetical protein